MIKQYQVTLFCATGQYKPVSTIVKADTEELTKVGKTNYISSIKTKGIQKICAQRYWGNKELKKYGYTKIKIREYDKEKIEQKKKERYEEIKRERGWAG